MSQFGESVNKIAACFQEKQTSLERTLEFLTNESRDKEKTIQHFMSQCEEKDKIIAKKEAKIQQLKKSINEVGSVLFSPVVRHPHQAIAQIDNNNNNNQDAHATVGASRPNASLNSGKSSSVPENQEIVEVTTLAKESEHVSVQSDSEASQDGRNSSRKKGGKRGSAKTAELQENQRQKEREKQEREKQEAIDRTKALANEVASSPSSSTSEISKKSTRPQSRQTRSSKANSQQSTPSMEVEQPAATTSSPDKSKNDNHMEVEENGGSEADKSGKAASEIQKQPQDTVEPPSGENGHAAAQPAKKKMSLGSLLSHPPLFLSLIFLPPPPFFFPFFSLAPFSFLF